METADIVGAEDPLWSGTQDMVAVRVCQNQTEKSERALKRQVADFR